MSAIEPVFRETFKRLSVTAVVVLYRTSPEQSPAYRSLLAARAALNAELGEVRVVLWDNSPAGDEDHDMPEGVHYVEDKSNSGLAKAYNHALGLAVGNGSEWLLTLDQDTAIPEDYFERMAEAARDAGRYAGIGALVPQIAAGNKQLSPNWFQFGALPRWYRSAYKGVPEEPVFAFNSGAMLSVAALQQVGGYDPRFWLDDSDAMIFSKLHQHGKRVYITGDIQVEHEFSMKDMQRRMSPVRYRNTLLAETAFWDLRMNRAAGWERSLRLMARLVKQWLRGDSTELRRITRDALMRRLFTSRRGRIEQWMRSTDDRAVVSPTTIQAVEPKISACMAAYNGEPFVEAQLRSILSQLKETDEVVVVDDVSSDETARRIEAVRDPRIRLLHHDRNRGVVATFEDALRSATGEILFLCDDDDLWAPTKARRFIEVFNDRPDAEIVTSRVQMIDEEGRPLRDSLINRGGRFLPGFWRNLYMNHYQGSAMAIKASLLGRVLPFPLHRLFLHDAWIGTRNDLLGGRSAFIDENLLFYRRHPKNASRTESLPWQIRKRIELLLAHIQHGFHARRSSEMLGRTER